LDHFPDTFAFQPADPQIAVLSTLKRRAVANGSQFADVEPEIVDAPTRL
jgi:hypothetical protein